MKKILITISCLLFPSFIVVVILKLLGNKVHKSAKIGFSLISVSKLSLDAGAKIGHFNMLKCNSISLGPRARIGKLNLIKGDIDVILLEKAIIATCNIITRASAGVTYGRALLKLGVNSGIKSFHKLDMTRSITMGDNGVLAGQSTQMWTHGYQHYRSGPGRYRVDGEIHMGNNVYIGASCVINAGVNIFDAVTVGSNSTVSKSITQPGLYVSQALRHIETDPEEAEKRLNPITGYNLVEKVYEKRT